MSQFPMHVVCEWIGNDPHVAMRHYLTATEADFQKAVGRAAKSAAATSASGAMDAMSAPSDNHKAAEITGNAETPVFLGFTDYPRQDSNLRPAV